MVILNYLSGKISQRLSTTNNEQLRTVTTSSSSPICFPAVVVVLRQMYGRMNLIMGEVSCGQNDRNFSFNKRID